MFVDVDRRFCILFAFLLLINRVSVQNIIVNGTIGGTIILPCSSSQNTGNVYWRYKDSMTLCDIIQGKVHFDEQDPVYKGRVKSFPSEFAKGNFSIRLSNLTKSDTGTYTCNFIHTLTPWTVQLKVTDARSGNVMRRPDSLLLFLLVCTLLSN